MRRRRGAWRLVTPTLAGLAGLAVILPVMATGPLAASAAGHRAGVRPADRSSPYGRHSPPALAPHVIAPTGSYVNPVSSLDLPDPDVVRAGSTYYAFATGNLDDNVSELSTTDLASWPDSYGDLTDALPAVGSWAQASALERVWAPSVVQYQKSWFLFYAAVDSTYDLRCIGVATAADPAGPYRDDRSTPLVCQPALGGSIDPDAFVGADGLLYLAWKSNGTATQQPTVWGDRLEVTGTAVTVAGHAASLVTRDQKWETTVENPAMVVTGGHYVLLFSGGTWVNASYATGYAICRGPVGPCQQPLDHPILTSDSAVAGPGGASVFADAAGQLWVAYAAWSASAVGYSAGGSRSLRLDPLCLPGGSPDVPGPSSTAMPLTPACPTTATAGYALTASNGSVADFDTPSYGPSVLVPSAAPIVTTARDPATGGFWEAGADGTVVAFDAPDEGSMAGVHLDAPIVGMAATADGNGYWLVASDGGIFAFGDARFEGSMGGRPLDAPIVGMAVDRWSGGYWLVASDGGIFAFGGAPFEGSMGGRPLNRPVVAMLPAHGGSAYWLVASDGGIFAFGDAPFLGSTGALTLASPIVGGAPNGAGNGYWLVAADGGIFAFGNAPFDGSLGGRLLDSPVVSVLPG